MTDEDPSDIERRDEWALTELDAAVGVVGSAVGAMYGPDGAILGAFVGPYAKLAVKRFMDLRTRIAEEVDLDDEELRGRLEENESLAQMIAEVVRGTVESDLEAKRRLLARAAIHALQDDAVVDVEARFVRTASEIDTADIVILAAIGEKRPEDEAHNPPGGVVHSHEIGGGTAHGSILKSLERAALIERVGGYPMIQTMGADPGEGPDWMITFYGAELLWRLREEGLEDELRRRSGEQEPG